MAFPPKPGMPPPQAMPPQAAPPAMRPPQAPPRKNKVTSQHTMGNPHAKGSGTMPC